eukprot:scaffold17766_cov54-Attheya_sp.AAC.3
MLANALEDNASLVTLNLGGNEVGKVGCTALAMAIEKNETLSVLDLGGNAIGDSNTILLARALEKNTALTDIHLNGNTIGNIGAMALAKVLENNRTLQFMRLKQNKIGDDGALALATGLQRNDTLEYISLNMNPIVSNVALKAFFNAMRCGYCFAKIYVFYQEIWIINGDRTGKQYEASNKQRLIQKVTKREIPDVLFPQVIRYILNNDKNRTKLFTILRNRPDLLVTAAQETESFK